MKNAAELNRILLKFVLLCQVEIQKISREEDAKIQLSMDNLGEQKVLEWALFKLLKSLKFKILGTMVPPPGYAGFITNLPFCATLRLERMPYDSTT